LATPLRSSTSTRDKQFARPATHSNGKRIVPKSTHRPSVSVTAGTRPSGKPAGRSESKPEAKILFQKFFHSVGPRTYAGQVKELANGNHLLVLTEGKRDADTGEVRKTRLLIFGEDFTAFFKLLAETAAFIRANPLSEEIKEKRRRFWAKKDRDAREESRPGIRPSAE
jgi:hypothetical protein